ncbi:34600_t:CDS:2 [Gigaspora margarita]|uniref:34600_t:CDS:1 n=1 Tax=Gigaspora margarita TaxID=4874 RepID=A0ABN7WHN8_GIGMA|nr:34600_t:CDS:2 [Gigaspora margarita]
MGDKNNKKISINLPNKLTANNNDKNLECSLNEAYCDDVDAEDLLEGGETLLENSDAITLEKGQSFDNFDLEGGETNDVINEPDHYGQQFLQPFNNTNEQFIQDAGFINEQLFYEEIWGLTHTAINKCLLHQNYEFVEIVKTYLASIHEKETRSQQANNSEN